METLTAQLIEKELIESLHFPANPVLFKTEKEKKDLKRKLELATILGNAYHTKIKIIFQDNEGLKEVRTTIWATGERLIVLKKGVFIPINRIVEVVI